MGAFEQLMEINSDLQNKEVFKSYFEQKKEIMKNENLKIRKKELEKLEEKYFKKVTKIGDENIVVGCLNNVIHKFLCFLPDEKLQALIIGTYDELKATEIMLKRHRSDVLTGKGDVYIGFNKFFQKVKPILIEIQKKIGHVNNEKILEMISGSIEKEIQRIRDYEAKRKDEKENLIMNVECFDLYQRNFVIQVYYSIKVIENKLEYSKLPIDNESLTYLKKFYKEMEDFLNIEYGTYIKWKNSETQDAIIRDIIILENAGVEEVSGEVYDKRETELKKLSFVKLKYKLRGTKAKITRMKNATPKFKTKEEIVNHIIKRHEEVLKPSKKALKSFKRTLLTANEDLLKRELKDTERLLTMLKTA